MLTQIMNKTSALILIIVLLLSPLAALHAADVSIKA